MSTLLRQMQNDAAFGHEIMQASGIRTFGEMNVDGLHVSVMTWFSKGKQVGPVFSYFKNNGKVQLIWPYRIKEPRIYQSTIKKALPILAKTEHSGMIAINVIINVADSKPYGVSWTTHNDITVLEQMHSLFKVGVSEWMRWLTDGVEGDWLMDEVNYQYAGTIIRETTDVNSKLLAFRHLGFELPLNSEDLLNQDESILQPPQSAPARSRQL